METKEGLMIQSLKAGGDRGLPREPQIANPPVLQSLVTSFRQLSSGTGNYSRNSSSLLGVSGRPVPETGGEPPGYRVIE